MGVPTGTPTAASWLKASRGMAVSRLPTAFPDTRGMPEPGEHRRVPAPSPPLARPRPPPPPPRPSAALSSPAHLGGQI